MGRHIFPSLHCFRPLESRFSRLAAQKIQTKMKEIWTSFIAAASIITTKESTTLRLNSVGLIRD